MTLSTVAVGRFSEEWNEYECELRPDAGLKSGVVLAKGSAGRRRERWER